MRVSLIGNYCINCLLVFFTIYTILPLLTDQPNDALATALSEVTANGGLVRQDETGAPHVKDPLSALAAAAELDQVRSDVAVVSASQTFSVLGYLLVFIV